VKWLCGSTSRSRRTFFSSISPSTTYVSAAASQRAAVSGGGFRFTADSISAFELTPPRQPIMFIERSTSRTTVESPDSAKARASHPTWHRTQRTTFHTRWASTEAERSGRAARQERERDGCNTAVRHDAAAA
jgi:hypothetical protein